MVPSPAQTREHHNHLRHPTTNTCNTRISSSFTLSFSFCVSSFNVCLLRFGGGRARFHGGGCKRTRNPCTPGCCPCTPGCCQRLEMLCVLWLQLLVLVHLLPQQRCDCSTARKGRGANASCSRRPTHRFDWWLERLECQRGKRFAAAAAARRLR